MDKDFDVVVAGAGPAGVAAAVAAAQGGARTLLVEAGSFVGGDAVSGLPILGCLNSRGQWVVGGVARQWFDRCHERGAYIGPVCDWRTVWGVCLCPEALRLVLLEDLARCGVQLLLYSFVDDVVVKGGAVQAVGVRNRAGRTAVKARLFVDATGDADLVHRAGGPCQAGDGHGGFQPVSLTFRMASVDYGRLLDFARAEPDQLLINENPVFGKTTAECVDALHAGRWPYMAIAATGPVLGRAIAEGRMHPCTALFITPTSAARGEVTINTTRIADLDATDPGALSESLLALGRQIDGCVRFVQRDVPGFERAHLSAVADRIGVRETRRIDGEATLTADAVLSAAKRADGIARGAHHVDIHGAGTDQQRIPIAGGGSYDIPFGCLVPRGLANVLAAGRCLSSDRQANGSARVMGTCMATGQAAGAASALTVRDGLDDVRDLDVQALRRTLAEHGAVLDGVD